MADIDLPQSDAAGKEPEKYIRTFAGDLETLQKGGTPDLAPFDGQSAKDKLVASSPIQPPAPAKPLAPEPSPAPVQTPPPSRPSELSPIETYAADFSERVKEQGASPVTVLAAEQDAARRPPPIFEEPAPPASRLKNVLYITLSVALVGAGGAGAYFTYARYTASQAPVAIAPEATAPIFVDEREAISGSGSALMAAIAQSSLRPLQAGKVRLLYLAATSTDSVFSKLPLSAPYVLTRNVRAGGSMAGVVSANGAQSPFFILSVESYSATFSGMLAWETTMPRDMGTLFPAYPPPTGTTTMQNTRTYPTGLPYGFDDETVSNHDVRAYRDAQGRIIFLYGYWNQSTLVIARDEAAFAEILQRIANSRSGS